MKRIIFLIIGLGLSKAGLCQSGEMLQTMLQQISALQGYIVTAEKGYKIAEDGWQDIKNIKNGEFNLHSVFFSSLQAVNPKVAQMSEVAEIIAIQISIAESVSKQLSVFRNSQWLQSSELDYINQVYSTILNAASEDVKDLAGVITNSELVMNDGERIKRIQAIDNNMRSQAGLVKGFSDHTGLLIMQRQHEDEMDGEIKAIYGIP
jgi:hypothetical protein